MLVIILLPVMLAGVVRIGFIQDALVHKLAQYMSSELNTKVQVEGMKLTYSGNLILSGFEMESPDGEKLASFGTFKVDLNRFNRKQSRINLGIIRLSDAEFYYTQQDSSTTNVDFLLDYFMTDEPSSGDSYDVYCDRIKLERTSVRYSDLSVDTAQLVYNFNKLEMTASNFVLTADTTGIRLDNMSFSSPELFDLKGLALHAGMSEHWISLKKMTMRTERSDMAMDMRIRFDSLSHFSEPFKHEIFVNANFKRMALIPDEFSMFMKELDGLEDTVFVDGKLNGLISKPEMRDFSFKAMPYVTFEGQAEVTNPQQIMDAHMKLDIERMYVAPMKIQPLAERFTGKEIPMPQQVKNLGDIRINGQFEGTSSDFYADAVFRTAAGDIVTDLDVKRHKASGKMGYRGRLEARNFNLRTVMASNAYGYVGFKANLDGVGLDKYADAVLEVTIDSILINNRRYNDIDVRGLYEDQVFDGLINIQTSRLKVTANGKADFSEELPRFIASINMPYADLKAMNLLSEDFESRPVISTSVMMHMVGDNPDNLDGWISVDNSRWQTDTQDVRLHSMMLELSGNGMGYHDIAMTSDFVDVSVDGKFDFDELLADMKYVASKELPALVQGNKEASDKQKNEKRERKGHYVNFRAEVNDIEPLTNAFAPGIRLADNSYISGTIVVDEQKLMLRGAADHLFAGILKFRDITIKDSRDSDIGMKLEINRIEVEDTLGIDNFMLTANAFSDSLRYLVQWDDATDKDLNKGDISGLVNLSKFPVVKVDFHESWFTTNDTLWKIRGNSYVLIDSNYVAVKDFHLGNDYQSLDVDGVLSADSADQIAVIFNKLNISNLDPFTNARKIDLDGKISGELRAKDVFTKHPTFTSDLVIDSIGFNHEHLGDAVIQSGWVDSMQAIFAKVEVKYQGNIGVSYPLKVQGYYFPYDREQNFDFDLVLKNFKLQTIAGYLEAFTTYFRGLATGEMHFRGNMEDPELSGEVKLMRTAIRIDYLNTMYSFADYVRFENNAIVFEDFDVNDNNSTATRGNKATLNGRISHRNFKEIFVDLKIDAEKFTVLNTSYSQNEMYYGSAIASGKVEIYGPTHNISLDVVGNTEKGTRLFVPLSTSEEASRSDFISFIAPQDTLNTISFEQQRRENVKGVNVNLNLEVTRDAELQVIFDETVGDIMKARGEGQIEINVDTRGDFSMFGNLSVVEGDYLFTLENIINKRFKVEEGGSITWNGDPFDATLDMNAVYRTEARLYDLVSYLDSSAIYKKRRPVECVIHLDGNLMNPEITPDIELPNADEITKQLVRTVLYVNANQVNQQEMNRQFVGLLVLNSFFPPADIGGGFGSGGMDYAGFGTTSSSELLSNQLSNWLSQISDDFNIGVNYRPGDDISNEELEVALSTQLFDDKVSISTNVGVGGNDATEQAVQGEETTNIVGDVNVEYKINEKVKLRAFNQHNNASYLEERGPYTQGVGVFYRKEFDKFADLFKRKKKQQKEDEKKPDDNESEPTEKDNNSETDNNLNEAKVKESTE